MGLPEEETQEEQKRLEYCPEMDLDHRRQQAVLLSAATDTEGINKGAITSGNDTTGASASTSTSATTNVGKETLNESTTTTQGAVDPNGNRKGFPFWMIMIALSFTNLLTALEATITSTALPSIIADLGGGDAYVWAVNGYLLTLTSLQPLYGQLANLFGRRWPIIIATATFVLGSGICGGARNMGMLIGGRALQGVGAGGIMVLTETIICDLIPLRQRGNYLAIIFGFIALGTALGPFFGGLIVQYSDWRWVFYLNLPIGGVSLVLLAAFLKVKWKRDVKLASRLTSIDWVGNAIFIAAIFAVLIALAWAGAVYPWASYHVLVPLLVGLAGMVGFLAFEGSRFAPQPTMPLRLMANRTSATAFVLTFLHAIVTMWALYFLPVYFQGVLGSSPARSGIQLLPTILIIIPSAAIGGTSMSKFGRYRPIHHVGFALIVISCGLYSLLEPHSSTGPWVGYQIVGSAGSGLIISTLLPAVMAPLEESDTALVTATWSFVRSFGMTWGIAIPAAIFNNRFDDLAPTIITDPAVRRQLINGQAYAHATADFLKSLSPSTREQVISVFNESLRRAWQVGIGFAALGLLLVFLEKEIPLRQELETEFGMENDQSKKLASEEDGILK